MDKMFYHDMDSFIMITIYIMIPYILGQISIQNNHISNDMILRIMKLRNPKALLSDKKKKK